MSALVIGATHDYARHWLAGRTKTALQDHAPDFGRSSMVKC